MNIAVHLPRRFITLGGVVLLGALPIVGAGELAAGPVSAQVTCSSGTQNVWTGNGDWSDPSNWSAASVPTSGTDACIAAGTVTVTGNDSAGSLEIASEATVEIDGGGPSGNLSVSTSVTNDGTLHLTETGGTSNGETLSVASPGVLTNTGTILTDVGTTGSTENAAISGDLDNKGQLTVNAATALNGVNGSTYTEDTGGTISIASGAELFVSGPPGSPTINNDTFQLAGGTIDNSGTLLVPGGTFTHTAGSESGNPIDLGGVALQADPSSGKASFYLYTTNNTLTGNIASGETIAITAQDGGPGNFGGGATLTVSGNSTNAGTIELADATTGSDFETQLVDTSGTITNTGTIESLVGGSGSFREIGASLTNEGALSIAANTSLDETAGTYENETGGTITVDSGTELVISTPDGEGGFDANHVFNLDGGTISNNGTFIDPGGTFHHNGGTATGNPIDIFNGALDPSLDGGVGTGAASFYVFGPSNTLVGNVATTDSIKEQANSQIDGYGGNQGVVLTANSSVTNAGTIDLVSPGNEAQLNTASSATLTNTGTIAALAGSTSTTEIGANLTNSGSLLISSPTSLNQTAGLYKNESGGIISVASGTTLTIATPDGGGGIDANHVFDLDGGTITDSGTFNDPDGTFNHNGGTVTGNAIVLSDNAMLDASLDGGAGEGSAAFRIVGNVTLVSSPTSHAVIAAGDSIDIDDPNAGSTLSAAGPITNDGTLSFTNESTNFNGELAVTGAFTNDGTLTSTVSEGGAPELAATTFTNNGSMSISPEGTSPSFDIHGDFLQGSGGTLSLLVDGTAAGAFSAINVNGSGNVAAGGTLSLEPGGSYQSSATAGDTDAILTFSGALTGTFNLTSVSPQSLTPPAITGTAVLGNALSCSAGTWTDSPTVFAYQWNRNGVAISTATSSTYTLKQADVDQNLTCTVAASGGSLLAGGNGFTVQYNSGVVDSVVAPSSETGATDATSTAVTISSVPQVISAPAIAGGSQPGSQLTCSTGTWTESPTSYAFSWNRDGSPISGAAGSTYTLQVADLGHGVTCTVTASNAHGSGSATTAAISVTEPEVTISTSSLPQAVGPNPYAQSITACGGSTPSCQHATSSSAVSDASGNPVASGSQFSFATTSGSLPPGIGLAGDGYLSGTPTGTGSFSFTVRATDPVGDSASEPLTLVVSASAISFSTTTLAGAVGATPYTQSITVCGGWTTSCEHATSTSAMSDASGNGVSSGAQFSFAAISGNLPDGISLAEDGYLSGTPTQAGSFAFTVRVMDPIGDTATTALTLVVTPGISIRTSNGAYVLSGPITAGATSLAFDASGALTGITTSSGSAIPYVTIGGGSSTDDQIGLNTVTSGPLCTTNLTISGSAGVLLAGQGITTTGCSVTSSGSSAGAEALAVRSAGATRAHAVPHVATAAATSTSSAAGSSTFSGQLGSLGTVEATGTFSATGSGSFELTVQGGTYAGELQGAGDAGSASLTSLIGALSSMPTTMPITPLTAFVDSYSSGLAAATALLNGGTSPQDLQTLMGAFGFPSGTTAEQVVPNFASSVSGTGAEAASILAELESEAAQLSVADRGSLVDELAAQISDGYFDNPSATGGTPSLASTLPPDPGTSQFLGGLQAFQSPIGTMIPSLAPVGSTIHQVLPVSPLPVPPPLPVSSASVTRVGPDAASLTIDAASPSPATAPFSSSGDTFQVVIVGS